MEAVVYGAAEIYQTVQSGFTQIGFHQTCQLSCQRFLTQQQINGEHQCDECGGHSGGNAGNTGHDAAHSTAYAAHKGGNDLLHCLLNVQIFQCGDDVLIGEVSADVEVLVHPCICCAQGTGELFQNQLQTVDELGDDHAEQQNHHQRQGQKGQQHANRAAELGADRELALVEAHENIDDIRNDRPNQQGGCGGNRNADSSLCG